MSEDSNSIAFGALSTYTIAQRQGARTIRDLYTFKGSTVFLVTKRLGADLATPDGIALLNFSV